METRKLSELKPNPLNPRGAILSDDSLVELAGSIRSHGVLQPILITPNGIIVAGHRRVKACEVAGRKEIACIVRDMSEAEQLQIMLIENLQRSDLDPVQEGKAFLELTKRGLTVNNIFQATGIPKARISNRIAVASLPERIHIVFATGKLPVSCVDCLADIPAPEQIAWVNRAVSEGWSGSQLSSRMKGAVSNASSSQKSQRATLREILPAWLDKIDRMDKEMDKHHGLQEVQKTLRRVSEQLIDFQVASARETHKNVKQNGRRLYPSQTTGRRI